MYKRQPYVVLSVMPRLKKMNQNVYEAALDLGATPFQALRKVILPEIRPGMISGFILAFTPVSYTHLGRFAGVEKMTARKSWYILTATKWSFLSMV